MNDELSEQDREDIAKRDAMLLELQLADDFTGIMCTEGGRRFIWSLLVEFGAFRELYSESHAHMAYMEGRRQVGLALMHKINTICPHQYTVMQTENTVYRAKDN